MSKLLASASSDAEDHYLYFSWYSDVAGHLGNGAEVHKRLSPGPHVITVWVDDTWDNVSKSVSIQVIETFPPNLVISSPMDGETYVTTTRVEFDASETTDPDSEILQFFWYSNIDGKLSERDSFLAKLSVGQHTLTLAVDDGNYNVTKTIKIDVLQNRPPVSVISDPEDKSEFYSDQLVELNGSQSYDLEDPITYFWVSARSGPLGNKPVLELYLPRGEHVITLWVDDDHGHNESASITLTVLNLVPTAGISSPEEDGTYLTGTQVFFNSESSNDPEDDKLYYEWFLRRGEGDWSAIGTQSNVQRELDTPGTHQVRLVVNDGKESDETTVTFVVEQAPDVDGGEEDGFLESPLFIGIMIVVVVAVGAVVVYLIKSRD